MKATAIVMAAIAALAVFDGYMQINMRLTVRREVAALIAAEQERTVAERGRTNESERRLAGCLRGDTVFVFKDGWVARPKRNDIGPALLKSEVGQL